MAQLKLNIINPKDKKIHELEQIISELENKLSSYVDTVSSTTVLKDITTSSLSTQTDFLFTEFNEEAFLAEASLIFKCIANESSAVESVIINSNKKEEESNWFLDELGGCEIDRTIGEVYNPNYDHESYDEIERRREEKYYSQIEVLEPVSADSTCDCVSRGLILDCERCEQIQICQQKLLLQANYDFFQSLGT